MPEERLGANRCRASPAIPDHVLNVGIVLGEELPVFGTRALIGFRIVVHSRTLAFNGLVSKLERVRARRLYGAVSLLDSELDLTLGAFITHREIKREDSRVRRIFILFDKYASDLSCSTDINPDAIEFCLSSNSGNRIFREHRVDEGVCDIFLQPVMVDVAVIQRQGSVYVLGDSLRKYQG